MINIKEIRQYAEDAYHIHPKLVLELIARLEAAENEIAYKQSQIDSLMLEYCPEEMTEEQLHVWGENQVPFKESEGYREDLAVVTREALKTIDGLEAELAACEACIKQAKAEAFEAAAECCDCMADGWEKNPGNNPVAGYIASTNCAAAIREMAKETQDDGYGADNPNTTDWRKPLSTKVEVL